MRQLLVKVFGDAGRHTRAAVALAEWRCCLSWSFRDVQEDPNLWLTMAVVLYLVAVPDDTLRARPGPEDRAAALGRASPGQRR